MPDSNDVFYPIHRPEENILGMGIGQRVLAMLINEYSPAQTLENTGENKIVARDFRLHSVLADGLLIDFSIRAEQFLHPFGRTGQINAKAQIAINLFVDNNHELRHFDPLIKDWEVVSESGYSLVALLSRFTRLTSGQSIFTPIVGLFTVIYNYYTLLRRGSIENAAVVSQQRIPLFEKVHQAVARGDMYLHSVSYEADVGMTFNYKYPDYMRAYIHALWSAFFPLTASSLPSTWFWLADKTVASLFATRTVETMLAYMQEKFPSHYSNSTRIPLIASLAETIETFDAILGLNRMQTSEFRAVLEQFKDKFTALVKAFKTYARASEADSVARIHDCYNIANEVYQLTAAMGEPAYQVRIAISILNVLILMQFSQYLLTEEHRNDIWPINQILSDMSPVLLNFFTMNGHIRYVTTDWPYYSDKIQVILSWTSLYFYAFKHGPDPAIIAAWEGAVIDQLVLAKDLEHRLTGLMNDMWPIVITHILGERPMGQRLYLKSLLEQHGVRLDSISGADFSNANLRDLDIDRLSLININLARADLRGAHVSHARVTGSLAGANLQKATFTEVSVGYDGLERLNYYAVFIKTCDLRFANLSDMHFARFGYWDPDRVIVDNALAINLNASVEEKEHIILSLTKQGAITDKSKMQNLLIGANGSQISLYSVYDHTTQTLTTVYGWEEVTGFHWEGADLSYADLKGTIFVGDCWSLVDTTLDEYYHYCPDISKKNSKVKKIGLLRNVNFENADLSQVRMIGVDLTGANFKNAILTGAELYAPGTIVQRHVTPSPLTSFAAEPPKDISVEVILSNRFAKDSRADDLVGVYRNLLKAKDLEGCIIWINRHIWSEPPEFAALRQRGVIIKKKYAYNGEDFAFSYNVAPTLKHETMPFVIIDRLEKAPALLGTSLRDNSLGTPAELASLDECSPISSSSSNAAPSSSSSVTQVTTTTIDLSEQSITASSSKSSALISAEENEVNPQSLFAIKPASPRASTGDILRSDSGDITAEADDGNTSDRANPTIQPS